MVHPWHHVPGTYMWRLSLPLRSTTTNGNHDVNTTLFARHHLKSAPSKEMIVNRLLRHIAFMFRLDAENPRRSPTNQLNTNPRSIR